MRSGSVIGIEYHSISVSVSGKKYKYDMVTGGAMHK
jgi:hypothetical protein